MSPSPRLDLPYIAPAQAQKHVTHNEALRRLDALVQLCVEGFEEAAPPALPEVGQVFALGATPTGDWAGHAHELALREESGWLFIVPQDGWRASLRGSADLRIWVSGSWQVVSAARQNLPNLGIAATADDHNRLSVSAPATLLNHAGSDHRLTVNKSAASDTAALLFQSGWQGHAEMGLTGNLSFTIKVSADGSSWQDALALAPDGSDVSGTVVHAGPYATGGGLMKVGAFGLGATADSAHLGQLGDAGAVSQLLGHASGAGQGDSPDSTRAHVGLHLARGSDHWAQILAAVSGPGDPALLWRRNDGTGPSGWQQIYDQGNVLGAVSAVAGQPTGALIEQGSNSNGQYLRFADGTQICTNFDTPITTAPASFTGTVTRIDGDKLWLGRWF